MYTQIKNVWEDLNENIAVNKRELALGLTTCTLVGALAGILIGMILGPTINMTIGSNNGNNNSAALPQESCGEETEEEIVK